MSTPRLSAAQRRLLALMQAGHRLWWCGDAGPELDGTPLWPQKATVRALLAQGRLCWAEAAHPRQAWMGICELRRPPDPDVPGPEPQGLTTTCVREIPRTP